MIKEIEASWTEFMNCLSDKEGDDVLRSINFPLLELFERQCHIDRARKDLFKKEMNHLLKLYLGRTELAMLGEKLEAQKKNFVRGFGQDRYNHLKLLVRLKIINQASRPKRGLLAV